MYYWNYYSNQPWLIKSATIMYNISQLLSLNISIPAFYRLCERSHEKTTGILTCHPKLIALYKRLHKKDVQSHFKLDAFEVPMLVPPRPWTSVTEGGYLALSCEQEHNIQLYSYSIHFFQQQLLVVLVTLINIVCCFVILTKWSLSLTHSITYLPVPGGSILK